MKKPAKSIATELATTLLADAPAAIAAIEASQAAAILPTAKNKAAAKKAAAIVEADREAEKADMDAKAARLQTLTNAPHLIAIPEDGHLIAIEDRRHTPAIEVEIRTPSAAKLAKDEASAQRVRDQVAEQIAAKPAGWELLDKETKVDHGPSNKRIADMLKTEAAQAPAEAPPIPTTGYQGPMLALRQRIKQGMYTKAANGQPSCGDELATTLGVLEPKEVIRACMKAMALDTNPYPHLNIGQQSMNLRNKLRGALKRNDFGMGVVREAVEEVLEERPAPAPAQTPAPAAEPAPAPAQAEAAPAPEPKPRARKASAKAAQ